MIIKGTSYASLLLILLTSCFTNPYSIDEIPDISSCIPPINEEVRIATWNIENFPKTSETSHLLEELILELNTDIIAVQEINDVNLFKQLTQHLPGWSYQLSSNDYQNIGFLYNDHAFTLEKFELLFNNEGYLFPRPVAYGQFTHYNSGNTYHIFNLHLKCCNGQENHYRRIESLKKIKDRIDTEYANDYVIIAGDFNEHPYYQDESIYEMFIKDNENYNITNLTVAKNDTSLWSYPLYPGHLDHIIISNELFLSFKNTKTANLLNCYAQYHEQISDHYPVIGHFE